MARNTRKVARSPVAARVYGYARVSTNRQADDGLSLDVQQSDIAAWATLKARDLLPVAEMFVERGASGSIPLGERLEGKRLLAIVRPGDIVITTKLDRMFRSARDALNVLELLKDGGVSLHMIDLGGDVMGNGISKMVFTILSAVAEQERERTRERIADVKRDQRLRGQFLGGTAPFGFSVGDDGALVPIPEQQAAIARMKELRAAGKSLRAISAEISAMGLRLSHVGVQKIVDQE